jgi:hypothetical protein
MASSTAEGFASGIFLGNTKQTVAGASKVDEKIDRYKNEIDLLVACSRRSDASSRSRIAALPKDDLDWNFLFGVSYRNGVFPLVFRNLMQADPGALPDEIRADVAEALKQHAENNMFLTSQIIRLVKIFEDEGIPFLPFKGPLLSVQAYGDPGLRSYGDLDVLVQPKHLDKAIRLLQKNDYTLATKVSRLQRSNWSIGPHKDVRFVDRDQRTVIELHWKLSGSHFGLPKEMNRLWERLESVRIAGHETSNLSFNDLLIYLCLHGSRHSWERFGWICDVYYLITSRDEIDWNSIVAESKRLGCENVVALGLKLVQSFFGLPIPQAFADSPIEDPAFDDIVSEITARLFAPGTVQVELGERYAYHLKLKERRFDKWKLHVHYLSWYLRIIVTPNQMDRDVFHLPRGMFPLYYLTRPFRLARTYLFKSH